jgi:peptide/nickel transport system permease protein
VRDDVADAPLAEPASAEETAALAFTLASDDSAPIAEAKRPSFGFLFWVAVFWLSVLAIVAIFANVLPLYNPTTPFYNLGPNAPASLAHWLGTDENGYDILSRLIYGARASLTIGILGTAIGVGIGGSLGLISAYMRGKVDAVLSYVMYTLLAFPAIIAVLAILSFWGTSEFHIIVVLGFAAVPLIFRLVRAATLATATREYVTAAKSQGATARRVLSRDILPNVAPSLFVYTLFTFFGIIVTEGALGFLGFSIQPPAPSLGNMISDGSNNATNLTLVFAPTLTIFFTLMALNHIGERIRIHYETGEQKL